MQIVFIESENYPAGYSMHEYARQRGYTATLLTRGRNKDYYRPKVLSSADRVIDVETNDIDALVSLVRSLNREERVAAVTTCNDMFVPQTHAVAWHMGLPSMDPCAVRRARNKHVMRQSLGRVAPELNPPFTLAYDIKDGLEVAAEWGYPFIAKPQDGNDSNGVTLIKSEAELRTYFEGASQWSANWADQLMAKGVLLEGYIPGQEFSVETLQAKGKDRQLVGVCAKVISDQERGVFHKRATAFPSNGNESRWAWEAVNKALTGLELNLGVIHTELRIHDGKVKIVEINPRIVGDNVGCGVIPAAHGRNLAEAVVDAALGEPVEWRPTKSSGAAICRITAPYAGIFRGIDFDESLKVDGVLKAQVISHRLGNYVDQPTAGVNNLGFVIAEAPNYKVALDRAMESAKLAKVVLEPTLR